MTFHEPKDDTDIQLLTDMNRQLIQDEGHRNLMTLPELYRRIQRWLAEEYRALIIQDDAMVIGYILFRRDTDWLYIRQFFIVPAFRRKGLGKLAIQKLREDVWRNTKIRLDVLVGNFHGVAFWESAGFSGYSLTMEYDN